MSLSTSSSISTLASLSVDCIEITTSFLYVGDIIRLYMTGNRRLQQLMSSGGVKTLHYNGIEMIGRPKNWLPSYLVKHLKTFEITYPTAIDIQLELLPKTLRRLNIEVQTIKRSEPYTCSTEGPAAAKSPTLDDLLPELTELRIEGYHNDPITIWCNDDLRLPVSLTTLHLPSNQPLISQRLMEKLPNLTKLRGDGLGTYTDYFLLPPNLTSLYLSTAQDNNILQAISKSTILRKLFLSTRDDIATHHMVYLRKLPSSLQKLTLNAPVPFDLIPSLPEGLKSLFMFVIDATAHALMQYMLPKGLEKLSIETTPLGEGIDFTHPVSVSKASFFQWLPKNLTWLDVSEGNALLLRPEELTQLPKGLNICRGLAPSGPQCLPHLPPGLRTIHLLKWPKLNSDQLAQFPRSIVKMKGDKMKMDYSALEGFAKFDSLLSIDFLETYLFEIKTNENGRKEFVFEDAMIEQSLSKTKQTTELVARIPLKFEEQLMYHGGARPLAIEFGKQLTRQTTIEGSDRASSHETFYRDENVSDLIRILDAPIAVVPSKLPRSLRTPFQGTRGLTIFQLKSQRLVDLKILTEFPRYLCDLQLSNLLLPLTLFERLSGCHLLNALVLNRFHQPLEDHHLRLLPRKIWFLQIDGVSSQISVEGFKALPPEVQAADLPVCAIADKQFATLTEAERKAIFTSNTELEHLSFYTANSSAHRSPWADMFDNWMEEIN